MTPWGVPPGVPSSTCDFNTHCSGEPPHLFTSLYTGELPEAVTCPPTLSLIQTPQGPASCLVWVQILLYTLNCEFPMNTGLPCARRPAQGASVACPGGLCCLPRGPLLPGMPSFTQGLVGQLGEYLSDMHETVGSIPSST